MKVLWFVSSLEQKGGGERFVLEGANALRKIGHEAVVVCDRLDVAASFDGRYDLSDVVCTSQPIAPDAGYLARALTKLVGIKDLFRIVRAQRPDLLICQSEFDAIKLWALSRFLKTRYSVFVFGQMFQFKTDITRYSSVFRKHLLQIVASRPGYRETVQLPPPPLSLPVWVTNELVSRLKRRAIRRASRVFALSNQVKWEVELLYERDAIVCRAAYEDSYIDRNALAAPRPLNNPIRLLSVSRLVDKKRIHLTIQAAAEASSNVILTIIGVGPDESRLRAIAANSKRSEVVRFLGGVSDEALQVEIASADCFVSMDIGDFDISVVEAMGKGLRVIVASDFDMSEFGSSFSGAVSVQPEVASIVHAIDALPDMAPPSIGNLPALERLTWRNLASQCVEA